MDEATRSNYRYQISRSQQRINDIQDEMGGLRMRINKLEEAKYEFNRMRNELHDDSYRSTYGMERVSGITSLNSANQISKRLLGYSNDTWLNENIDCLNDALQSADNEIASIEERLRAMDTDITRLHANISSLQYRLSQS